MRIFVIADIHGNLPALEAVLADLKRLEPCFEPHAPKGDRLICLGDVIGYYAHPNEVMDQVWGLTEEVLIGNHEISVHEFLRGGEHPETLTWGVHPHAAWAFKWTAEHLNAQNRARLDHLMLSQKYSIEDRARRALFAHAAPHQPELMTYITSGMEAHYWFFEPPACHFYKVAFIGHSHIPQIYRQERETTTAVPMVEGGMVLFRQSGALTAEEQALPPAVKALQLCESADGQRFEKTWPLPNHLRTLVSVPSVGQPRDRLPYAGYAIFDTVRHTVTMVRLAYDVGAAVAAMQKLPGCPEKLITRLMAGR